MWDVLLDVCLDTLKILPFLFLAYLAMEYLEHHMSAKTSAYLASAEHTGPLIGAAVGAVPQCGFSATAAGFYSGGLITAGTLLAVFLSTSDEMIPVMIGSAVPLGTVLKIVAWKIVIAAVTGLLVDRILRLIHKNRTDAGRIEELCHDAHCSCGEGHGSHIARSALRHTVRTIWVVFAVSLAAGLAVEYVGADVIRGFLTGKPLAGTLLMALIGLLPNCAASVMITTFYMEKLITFGQLMAGLLVGAGVGVAVLFRNNRHWKENAAIVGTLYGAGVLWGILLEILHIAV